MTLKLIWFTSSFAGVSQVNFFCFNFLNIKYFLIPSVCFLILSVQFLIPSVNFMVLHVLNIIFNDSIILREEVAINGKKIFKEMVVSFIKMLDEKQFDSFLKISDASIVNNFSLIDEQKEIKEFIKSYALKNLDLKLNDINKNNSNFSFISKIYKEDIFRINNIIQNKNLLKQIGGAKILLYGETGTGKTTIVNKIIQDNPSISFKNDLDFTNLISYKMGQTQINLLKLSKEINEIEDSTIIFIDEFDSIITNRSNKSDLGEHARIVGTFLKFLDEIPNNIILIAATNYKDTIDSAVLRRFNMLFETRMMLFPEFISFLSQEDLKLEKGKEEILKK